MKFRTKLQFFAKFVLQLLNVRINSFYHTFAPNAYKMVMMCLFILGFIADYKTFFVLKYVVWTIAVSCALTL